MTQEESNACDICTPTVCNHWSYFKVGYPTGEIFEYVCAKCGQRNTAKIHHEKKGRKMQKETRRLRTAIFDIIEDIDRRMTVRQVYYQAVHRGIFGKAESNSRRLQRQVLLMRRDGTLPYSYITDNSRLHMKGDSYKSAQDAVSRWIRYYKQDIWADNDVHVEIWLEKRALAGVISDITYEYDVPLYVSSGFSSDSFIYDSVELIKALNKPAYVYYFSDYDKAGLDIAKSAEKRFREFAGGDLDINFIRAGLTKEQVEFYNLSSRPSKDNTEQFKAGSTELDALHPDDLVALVENCITQHITVAEFEKIKQEEAIHLETLNKLRLKL